MTNRSDANKTNKASTNVSLVDISLNNGCVLSGCVDGIDWRPKILLEVEPQYANLIVDGFKTVELRRKFPNSIELGTTCLVYATSPVNSIIGECKIDKIEQLPIDWLWRRTAVKSMMGYHDFNARFAECSLGVAIYLYDHQRYETPIRLS